MADPFIGEIQAAGFNFAPRDWGLCRGALVQISQFSALYAIIGSTYGGDGRVSMGLPHLNGRVPLGEGLGPGLRRYVLGEFYGYNEILLNEQELPVHTHAPINGDLPNDSGTPSGTVVPANMTIGGGGASGFVDDPVASETYMSPHAITTYGASQAHENRQPFLALNFIIAMDGIFPPRN